MTITLRVPLPEEAGRFADMTFPRFRARLGDPDVVLVVAFEGDAPVGLGVGAVSLQDGSAEILSLFAAPERRGRGVATALLDRLQTELSARGAVSARLSYASDKPTVAALERVIQKCGWMDPALHMYIGRATRSILDVPWTRRVPSPPLTLFPWRELTTDARRAILRRQSEGPWYPPVLLPFAEEPAIDPVSSVGLRRGDEVLGWMINHRVGTSIRYSALFVDPALRDQGCGVALCGQALHRQDWDAAPTAIFAVMVDNTGMLDTMLRNIAPNLASLTEMRTSSRALAAPEYYPAPR